MKSQRYECNEAVRFILEFAELDQVINALFFRFHVAVEHRRIGVQPGLMRLARRAEPHLPAHLVIANDSPHARMENLGSAAGAGIHPRFLHLAQRFLDRELRDARKVVHLDHRERLQVHAGTALFQTSDELEKVVKGQIRVQPADDMKLRGALAHALLRSPVNLLERVRVRAGRIRVAAKGAQLAMGNADVRGIDVAVHVVVGDVAVTLFAHVIRQPADTQQVRRTVERDAVFHRETHAGEHFLRNRLESFIGKRQFSHGASTHLLFHDSYILCRNAGNFGTLLNRRKVQTRHTAAATPQQSRNAMPM